MKDFFKKYFKKYNDPVITLSITIAVAVAFVALYTAADTTARQVRNQNTIVSRLESASKERDKAVQSLIADNNQQTLILCKLILGDNTSLSPDEVTQVEAICKERIKEAAQSPVKTLVQPSQAAPAQTPSSTPSQPQTSPQPAQNTPNSPPEEKPSPPKALDCKVDLLGVHIGCP